MSLKALGDMQKELGYARAEALQAGPQVIEEVLAPSSCHRLLLCLAISINILSASAYPCQFPRL
jgi:hypothetical protein